MRPSAVRRAIESMTARRASLTARSPSPRRSRRSRRRRRTRWRARARARALHYSRGRRRPTCPPAPTARSFPLRGGPGAAAPWTPRCDVPHASSAKRGQRAARECGARVQQVRNGGHQRSCGHAAAAARPARGAHGHRAPTSSASSRSARACAAAPGPTAWRPACGPSRAGPAPGPRTRRKEPESPTFAPKHAACAPRRRRAIAQAPDAAGSNSLDARPRGLLDSGLGLHGLAHMGR